MHRGSRAAFHAVEFGRVITSGFGVSHNKQRDFSRRSPMRTARHLILTLLLMGLGPWLHGQDRKTDIQTRLSSQFVLTKTTADRSDIVTSGSVVVLHKDGLLMFSLDSRVMPTITCKDGKLSMGFGDTLSANIALNSVQQGTNVNNVAQRKFVAGEKFWITAIQ